MKPKKDPFFKYTARLMELHKGLANVTDQVNDLIESCADMEEDADIIRSEDVWKTLREIPKCMQNLCDEVDDQLADLEYNAKEGSI